MSPENIVHIYILLAVAHVTRADETNSTSLEYEIMNSKSGDEKILSRKRRFLVFPEGSSLQLVFCVTDASIAVIDDIFLWGSTAALAWELPQDPYSPFDHHADPLHRRQDVATSVHYIDNRGKLLFKVPYKRKPIVNPAFAKRSVEGTQLGDNVTRAEVASDADRSWLHERQREREFLKTDNLDENSVEFHRHSRKKLFEKLEVFMKTLGMGGRQCVLRTLCQAAGTRAAAQGTFLEELARAAFTLPRGRSFPEMQHQAYDTAAGAEDCEELYPDCHTGSWTPEVSL